MAQFVKTIQNFSFQYDLWRNGSKIIVGVSGGPDSACLLDVLAVLAKKYDFQLHIAHVNYRLRGEDSDKDEALVRKLGEQYGIEVSVLRPLKSLYEGNLENSLRDIRYGYFEKLRREMSFDLIAVAHNQDDQAETVLMRVLRGSGLNGLSSMKPKSGTVIRPLLTTGRNEIEAYLKEKKLKFRKDKSNADSKFTRNRIRQELIPYLEKKINPSIKKTLANWSLSVADDHEFIAISAERFANSACKNNCARFKEKDFSTLHPALQRQSLMAIIAKLKKNTTNIESSNISEVIKIIKSAKAKTQKASFAGLKVSKKGDIIEIFC